MIGRKRSRLEIQIRELSLQMIIQATHLCWNTQKVNKDNKESDPGLGCVHSPPQTFLVESKCEFLSFRTSEHLEYLQIRSHNVLTRNQRASASSASLQDNMLGSLLLTLHQTTFSQKCFSQNLFPRMALGQSLPVRHAYLRQKGKRILDAGGLQSGLVG